MLDDPHPSARLVRLLLANGFPDWTQRFWTYLMGIDLPEAPPRRPWKPTHHVACWGVVWMASMAVGIVSADLLLDVLLSGSPLF